MIIQSTRVYIDESFKQAQIEIQDGKITAIYPYNNKQTDIDYEDAMILPGLVDIHNHGYLKSDANHAKRSWLDLWTSYLPSEGVTSTLSTISTYPYNALLDSLSVIGDYIDYHNNQGTHILGVYSEGPFISKAFKGAQNEENQVIPTVNIIKEMNDACNGHLIYVMIAPEELNHNYDVIKYCVENKMTVSLGHTGATYDVAQEAVDAGATSFTHTYNGMRGLHHREPGTLGCAMINDHCYCECIADGVHVNPISAKILAKLKGKDKFILITDSVAIKGLPVGHYKDDTREVTICEDGVGRLSDGTIAGSCNKLNKVLDFAINKAHIDPITAINGATINPLKCLHIPNKGLIKEGYDADIAVFDNNFNTISTFIDGQMYYNNHD